MNAFTASVPPSHDHPLLREKFTELLSIRIGPILKQKLIELGEANNTNVIVEVRNALVKHVDPEPMPERQQPQPIAVPLLSETEKAVEAFGNDYIIKAIKSVAKCLEEGSIQCDSNGIVNHFISICPQP